MPIDFLQCFVACSAHQGEFVVKLKVCSLFIANNMTPYQLIIYIEKIYFQYVMSLVKWWFKLKTKVLIYQDPIK